MNYKIFQTLMLAILIAINLKGQENKDSVILVENNNYSFKKMDTLILIQPKYCWYCVANGPERLRFAYNTKIIDASFHYILEFNSLKTKGDKSILYSKRLIKNPLLELSSLDSIPKSDLHKLNLNNKIFFIFEEELENDSIYLYPVKMNGVFQRLDRELEK